MLCSVQLKKLCIYNHAKIVDLRLRWQKKIGSLLTITKISELGQVISFYLDKSSPSLNPTKLGYNWLVVF